MELSTRYTPKDIEEPLYTKWNDSGCFQPPAEGEGSGKPFTVMIPPPNVTGVLHMGHALNGTVQDIAIEMVRIAKEGLVRRGANEENFVDGLMEMATSGQTQADKLLDAYVNKWGMDIDKVYKELSF